MYFPPLRKPTYLQPPIRKLRNKKIFSSTPTFYKIHFQIKESAGLIKQTEYYSIGKDVKVIRKVIKIEFRPAKFSYWRRPEAIYQVSEVSVWSKKEHTTSLSLFSHCPVPTLPQCICLLIIPSSFFSLIYEWTCSLVGYTTYYNRSPSSDSCSWLSSWSSCALWPCPRLLPLAHEGSEVDSKIRECFLFAFCRTGPFHGKLLSVYSFISLCGRYLQTDHSFFLAIISSFWLIWGVQWIATFLCFTDQGLVGLEEWAKRPKILLFLWGSSNALILRVHSWSGKPNLLHVVGRGGWDWDWINLGSDGKVLAT